MMSQNFLNGSAYGNNMPQQIYQFQTWLSDDHRLYRDQEENVGHIQALENCREVFLSIGLFITFTVL